MVVRIQGFCKDDALDYVFKINWGLLGKINSIVVLRARESTLCAQSLSRPLPQNLSRLGDPVALNGNVL